MNRHLAETGTRLLTFSSLRCRGSASSVSLKTRWRAPIAVGRLAQPRSSDDKAQTAYFAAQLPLGLRSPGRLLLRAPQLRRLADVAAVDSTFAMNNMKRWAYSPA